MKSPSFDGDVVYTQAPPTANAEFAVSHSLGRIPQAAFVIQIDKVGRVYKGSTAWTAAEIFLRSTGTTHGLKLLLV